MAIKGHYPLLRLGDYELSLKKVGGLYYDTPYECIVNCDKKEEKKMKVWQFIIFIILWIPIEYLCIHLEVKQNPDLFYALYQKDIIKSLNKLEKRRKNEKRKNLG